MTGRFVAGASHFVPFKVEALQALHGQGLQWFAAAVDALPEETANAQDRAQLKEAAAQTAGADESKSSLGYRLPYTLHNPAALWESQPLIAIQLHLQKIAGRLKTSRGADITSKE